MGIMTLTTYSLTLINDSKLILKTSFFNDIDDLKKLLEVRIS